MRSRRRSGFIAPPSHRGQASAVTAMTLVALITAVGSLPAQAMTPGGSGLRAASGASMDRGGARSGPVAAQSVTVTAESNIAVQHDSYAAEAVARPPVVAAPAAAEVAPAAPAPVAAGSTVRWPFPGVTRISDGYGPRVAPCAGCSTFHDGLDMNPGVGTPIGSIADGVVSSVTDYDDGGLGVHVMVDHVVDGQRITSTYGHMLIGSVTVGVGQSVGVGQQLGNVGSTGQSTGPHMHLELHLDGVTAIDPFAWLTEHAGPM